MIRVEHDVRKCIQCYDCVKYCSAGALRYVEGAIIYSSNNCVLCEVCMDVCDSGAIEVKE